MADSGYSPTDIITYIGVPLAVLGVLPILYNTAATLAALSRIKRMLRHSKLTALTRSDVVNRVIEVELPRYAVRPLDDRLDVSYWSLSRHPSSIPGGSWTQFNWRTQAIGLNTQRVEYADQLRQPQVETAFDELVCYLMDLGAVPNPHGWRLLRSTGLWTPVGSSLMMSPDGMEKALTIAPLDGSDGHLSLAVTWAGPWTTRDHSHLPPYWVRLYPPPPPPSSSSAAAAAEHEFGEDSISAAEGSTEQLRKDSSSSNLNKSSLDSARQQGASNLQHPITCQISSDGIISALPETTPHQATHDNDSPETTTTNLYIEHIRLRPAKSDGAWFASAATAYGTTSQTILWNYKIADDVLAFARKETVPCGVLVLLRVVDEAATPEWATQHDSGGDQSRQQLDAFARRGRDRHAAMDAEARMPPAQKAVAVRERMRKESEMQLQDMRDRMRVDRERKETRMMEALQSPKWDTKLVGEHNFAWLQKTGEVDGHVRDVRDAVGTVLHRMVLDGQFSSKLCRMLDLWKAWAENGGMRKSDLAALQDDQVTFAYATLLVAVIKDTSTALEGTLSMDLQECLRMWRTVRLG